MNKIYCFFCVILLLSCKADPTKLISDVSNVLISEVQNPSNNSSGESSLLVNQDGQIYLSWIDLVSDTINKLQYAKLLDPEFKLQMQLWLMN